MKIRTLDELNSSISADLAWRKKELSVYLAQVQRADRIVQRALLRGAISILYAHWEGYVKHVIHAYLCYLSRLGLTYTQLRPEIAGFALRRQLEQFKESNRSVLHAHIVRQLRGSASELARIPDTKDAVKTKANLNFERLTDLLVGVGCDCERYKQYRDLIDEQLLSARNRVVHGEEDYIHPSDWIDLRGYVISIMEDISTQILNSAAQRDFLASP